LLNSFKVAIPIGEVAFNEVEACKIAKNLRETVLLNQKFSGGRGMKIIRESGYKGGVKVVDTEE
jgi:succinyl-CoA synthetase beta subunit